MKKKIMNIIVIIITCISINMYHNEVFARLPTEDDEVDIGYATGINPDDYEPDSLDTAIGADRMKNIGNSIIGTLQIIGTILSVSVLIVLGIKYMMGSVEEKAEYKKAMMPYVVGAIMVFAITNLLGIVASIAKGIFA